MKSMHKNNIKKYKRQSDKEILAEVTREMARTRMTKSAREQSHLFSTEVLVAENHTEMKVTWGLPAHHCNK
jgi:hypothetical protein